MFHQKRDIYITCIYFTHKQVDFVNISGSEQSENIGSIMALPSFPLN
jgi:hypothetical protein